MSEKKAPNVIYMQDEGAGQYATWCADRINDDDVVYVRLDAIIAMCEADLYQMAGSIRAQVRKLESR